MPCLPNLAKSCLATGTVSFTLIATFLLLLVFVPGEATAQKRTVVDLAFTGHTAPAGPVCTGCVQLEGGIGRSYAFTPDAVVSNAPSTLLRVGVLEGIELRAGAAYTHDRIEPSSGGETTVSGFNELTAGALVRVAHAGGLVPDATIHVNFSLPGGSHPARSRSISPQVLLAAAHEVSERFTLNYNLGGRWRPEQPDGVVLFGGTLRVELNRRLSVFTGTYGTAFSDNSRVHGEGGFACLITGNLRVNGAVSLSPSGAGTHREGSVGFVWVPRHP